MKKINVVLIFLAFSIFFNRASAVGLIVSPSEVLFSAGEAGSVKSITVKNPTSEVLLFEIYPDIDESFVKITPSSFVLESGAEKKIFIKIKIIKTGILKTNLSVTARPLSVNGDVKTGGGVKIPVVAVNNSIGNNLFASISNLRGNLYVGLPIIIFLCLITAIFIRRNLKKSEK